MEFGSFLFSFDTPAALFEDRRHQLEEEVMQRRGVAREEMIQQLVDEQEEQELPDGSVRTYTDIGRFLRLV